MAVDVEVLLQRRHGIVLFRGQQMWQYQGSDLLMPSPFGWPCNNISNHIHTCKEHNHLGLFMHTHTFFISRINILILIILYIHVSKVISVVVYIQWRIQGAYPVIVQHLVWL